MPLPRRARHTRAVSIVFLHGTGSAGPKAWPLQAAALGDEAHFVRRVHDGDHPDHVQPVVIDALAPRGHLVAHSYGCVSAVLAATERPDVVASLVLCEPPFVGLTAGWPETDAHVAALAPLFERRSDPTFTDLELSAGFATAVGMPVPDFTPDQLARSAARLRAFTPAWLIAIDPTIVGRVPTLVVTSGNRDIYDEVAYLLEGHGATRLVLSGHGHRVQDHPDATAAFRRFWGLHDVG